MGVADRCKRTKGDGVLWVWVGFLVTLAVGSVICWGVFVALSPARQSAAIEATHQALAKRGITEVGEEVKVEAFGDATCLVTGQCMQEESIGVYVSTCKLSNGRWRVVKLELPVAHFQALNAELNRSLENADKLLKEATR